LTTKLSQNTNIATHNPLSQFNKHINFLVNSIKKLTNKYIKKLPNLDNNIQYEYIDKENLPNEEYIDEQIEIKIVPDLSLGEEHERKEH
jgi:hypothetical protein